MSNTWLVQHQNEDGGLWFTATCDDCGWESKDAGSEEKARSWERIHRERGCPA